MMKFNGICVFIFGFILASFLGVLASTVAKYDTFGSENMKKSA